MKTKLVPIGNSRGVRIPKTMIEEANLIDDVEVKIRDGSIIISSLERTREGWSEFAKELHKRGSDKLVLKETETKFEKNEWNW